MQHSSRSLLAQTSFRRATPGAPNYISRAHLLSPPFCMICKVLVHHLDCCSLEFDTHFVTVSSLFWTILTLIHGLENVDFIWSRRFGINFQLLRDPLAGFWKVFVALSRESARNVLGNTWAMMMDMMWSLLYCLVRHKPSSPADILHPPYISKTVFF